MLCILEGLLLAIGIDQRLFALAVLPRLHLLLGINERMLAFVLFHLRVGVIVVVMVQAGEVEHAFALAEHLTLLDGGGKTPVESKIIKN